MINKKKLISKIISKEAKIGIIGLGYVGLPLACIFAKNKFNVFGFDIDNKKIDFLKKNRSYIKHIKDSYLRANKKRFFPTNNLNYINHVDIIILCLPTPLKENKKPELKYIKNTLNNIFKFLKKGQTLILESSTYPGSTKELVNPLLKKSKFKVGEDFFIGYSPEREDPTNKIYNIKNIPKICSGYTINCREITNEIYSKIVDKTVKVKNIETAEFSKIFENTYRSVNIALVNELKILAKKNNLDMNEIIQAAKTKPFGFQAFKPGPGVGGHCIPVDPYYLQWVADKKKN